MIHVDHLNFAYPGVDDTPGVSVFVDLELEIEKGSFVAVLGGNGWHTFKASFMASATGHSGNS